MIVWFGIFKNVLSIDKDDSFCIIILIGLNIFRKHRKTKILMITNIMTNKKSFRNDILFPLIDINRLMILFN